ncbi:MAG TPA: RidA family protein [Burkholderiaceae bacterium]|jgi:2-iminobutanoate/2-iminopropanoate deaminase|nr:RidA family protein [Burkholderiaceae bacterium]
MSTRKIVNPSSLTKPRAPLSHGVKVGNLVFVSGTTPFKPGSRDMAPDFAGQMHQVMQNIKVILEEAGTSLDRIVKSNVILTRISDFQEMNDIYRSYFADGNYPARTTIEAPLAVPGMLLEIECVAEL